MKKINNDKIDSLLTSGCMCVMSDIRKWLRGGNRYLSLINVTS